MTKKYEVVEIPVRATMIDNGTIRYNGIVRTGQEFDKEHDAEKWIEESGKDDTKYYVIPFFIK